MYEVSFDVKTMVLHVGNVKDVFIYRDKNPGSGMWRIKKLKNQSLVAEEITKLINIGFSVHLHSPMNKIRKEFNLYNENS